MTSVVLFAGWIWGRLVRSCRFLRSGLCFIVGPVSRTWLRSGIGGDRQVASGSGSHSFVVARVVCAVDVDCSLHGTCVAVSVCFVVECALWVACSVFRGVAVVSHGPILGIVGVLIDLWLWSLGVGLWCEGLEGDNNASCPSHI